MAFRLMGYDGASYRSQLLSDKVKEAYPVVAMVLYFGLTPWPYGRHLLDTVKTSERLKPFASNYEIKNLFQIAFLTLEQVAMFRSDFRYVAEYFVQKRLYDDYQPDPGLAKHVDEVLKLMSVLTGDDRFKNAITEVKNKDGGETMESILDRIENRGEKRGIEIGEERGEKRGRKTELKQAKFRYIMRISIGHQQI